MLKLVPVVAALGLAISASAASAYTLTFPGGTETCGVACVNSMAILQSYGDVAGVVDVQYSRNTALNTVGALGSEMFWWGPDYNTLFGVAYGDGGPSPAQIYLAPLNGQAVTLNSLSVGAWPNSTIQQSQLTITDGVGNVLASTGVFTVGDAPNDPKNFLFLNASSLTGIRIFFGPEQFNVGIDNIDFSLNAVNAVPIPGALPLFATGLGMMGFMGWRRKRKAAALAAA